MFFDNTKLDIFNEINFKWDQINQKIYTHISTDSNYCWFLDSKLQWIVFLLQETTRCFVPVAVFFTILRFKTSSFIILFLAIILKQIIAYSSLLVNFKMISNLVFMKMVTRKKLVLFFKIHFNHYYFIIENFLPDFLFPSGGLITRDFDRLTRSDRRLTSLRNVAARSGNLIPGLFVGVTQYCVANILIIWTCQVIRDVGIQLIRFD